METKCCTKCNKIKNLDKINFRLINKKKRNKTYFYSICRECEKQEKREYRKTHTEEIKEYNKKQWAGNKESYKKQHAEYRIKNRDKINRRRRERRKNNKEHYKEQDKKYRLENKEAIQERNNKYKRRKRKTDAAYRLRSGVSRSIYKALKKQGKNKNNSILKYLSYTMEELKIHIESQWESWMSWDNHGVYKLGGEKKWHIDHIISQADLPYDSMEHPNFKKCWALDNLRPLEAVANMQKGKHKDI